MNALEVIGEAVKAFAVAARNQPINNVYGNASNVGHRIRHVLLEFAPNEAATFIRGLIKGLTSECNEETAFHPRTVSSVPPAQGKN